jgi:hypothetical protein
VFAGSASPSSLANAIDLESLAFKPPFDTLPINGPGSGRIGRPGGRERAMLSRGWIGLPMLPRYYVPFAEIGQPGEGAPIAIERPIRRHPVRSLQDRTTGHARIARGCRSSDA